MGAQFGGGVLDDVSYSLTSEIFTFGMTSARCGVHNSRQVSVAYFTHHELPRDQWFRTLQGAKPLVMRLPSKLAEPGLPLTDHLR